MKEIDLDEVWYVCPFAGFLAKKKKDTLKVHMANKHDIGKPLQNKRVEEETNQEALEALEQAFYVCFLCDGHGVWPLKVSFYCNTLAFS